jgi:excisionase family DNA binding protein
MKKEISAREAARKLSVNLAFVYNLLWSGKLEARKDGKRWLISAESVERRRASGNKLSE